MNSIKRAAKLAYYYQTDFDFAVSVQNWFKVVNCQILKREKFHLQNFIPI